MESNNDNKYPYLKLFPEEYLGGSLHYACSLEERGFFVDLICLAAKNRKERGTLSLEKGQPMSTAMIASALFITESDCSRLLGKMLEQERIYYREPEKVIVVTNFNYYQTKYRRSYLWQKKQEAKANSIAKANKTKRRKGVLLEREIENINQQNVARKMSQNAPIYDILDQNKFINTDTGEVFDNENDYLKSIREDK